MEQDAILDAIKARRSCRAYTDQKVEKEKIEKIIEAGGYAPTGMNRQKTIFLDIEDEALIKRLSHLNATIMGNPNGDPFYGAKSVIVVLAANDTSTKVYDGSIAMAYMMLEADSLGVASCWVHRAKEVFSTEEGKAILKQAGIEGEYEGIGNLILGYPDESKFAAHPKSKEGRVFHL